MDLSNNPGLGETGFTSFAREFSVDTPLKSLDLSNCNLCGASSGQALAVIMTKATQLEQLTLADNEHLSDEGLDALAQDLSGAPVSLTALNLAHCGLKGAEGGRAVAVFLLCLPSLRELNLRNNDGLEAEGIMQLFDAEFAQLPLLDTLTLSRTGLAGVQGGHAVSSILRCMPTLQLLLLASNNFRHVGLQTLAEEFPAACGLQTLDLSRSDSAEAWNPSTGAALAVIASKLTTLVLSENTSLSSECISTFANSLPEKTRLQTLLLGGCALSIGMERTWTEGCRALWSVFGKATALRQLDLSHWPLLEDAATWPSVQEEMDLSSAAAAIVSLSLRTCSLSGATGGSMAAGIVRTLKSLEALDLTKNFGLKASGLRSFADGMRPHMSLKHLVLDHCGLKGVEGGSAVAHVAKSAPQLEDLSLSGNNELGSCGVQAVANGLPALSDSHGLKRLDVSNCGIEDVDGARALALVAHYSQFLEMLCFSNNALCNSGLKVLVQELPKSMSLQSLNLGYCDIEGEDGGRIVADLVARVCSS